MLKNVASQKIGAQLVSAVDGSAFTGTVTVAITGDAGTQATGTVGSGVCTHEGNGYHTYAPSKAETNYDLIAFTFTGTGAIPVTIQVFTSAGAKLSALTEVSVPDLADITYEVDVSDTTDGSYGTSRKVSFNRLLGMLNHIVQGRLTLTTNVPVTYSDVSGATSIYFTPFTGNCVSLYDGTRWKLYNFTQLTLAVGTVVTNQAYDIFLYDSSGTLTLESLEWANATATMTIATPGVVTWTSHGMVTGNSVMFTTTGALPTGVSANTRYFVNVINANTFNLSTTLVNLVAGTYVATSGSQSGTHTAHGPHARATALTTQNGVYVKTGDTTRRFLGTFIATSTTATEDSGGGTTTQVGGKRFLQNMYNRQPRHLAVMDTTNTWTYNVAAFRVANGAAAPLNCVEFVCCLPEVAIEAALMTSGYYATTTHWTTALGLDGITIAGRTGSVYTNNTSITSSASYRGMPGIGYHYLTWLEKSTDANIVTFAGDDGGDASNGIAAIIWG